MVYSRNNRDRWIMIWAVIMGIFNIYINGTLTNDNNDDSDDDIDDDDDSGDYDDIDDDDDDDDDNIHDYDSDDVVGMRKRLVLMMTIYAMLCCAGTHIIFAWYLTNNENNVLWEFSLW